MAGVGAAVEAHGEQIAVLVELVVEFGGDGALAAVTEKGVLDRDDIGAEPFGGVGKGVG